MTIEHSISHKVSDIEAFGQTLSMLMHLSKYLDTAANSVLGGNLVMTETKALVARAGTIYTELRGTILELITDKDTKAQSTAMLRPLHAEMDVLEAALVVDQSHCWLETSIRRGTFSHRVKILDLQLGLEEAAANAQLSEQRGKVEFFEKRGNDHKNGNGAYV
jgi:hypothetical protein